MTAAKVFEGHLKSLPGPDAVVAEFEALMNRRPRDIESLPPILTDSLPLQDLLHAQSTRQYQRIFRSFEHQQAVKDEYDRLNDEGAPACDDLPTDIEGQHKLVEELFYAIINNDFAEEQPRLLVKKSRKRKASDLEDETGDHEPKDNEPECRQWVENTYVKRIRMATDVEIQFLAWNLLVSSRHDGLLMALSLI